MTIALIGGAVALAVIGVVILTSKSASASPLLGGKAAAPGGALGPGALRARITTSDPAPLGDVMTRPAPDAAGTPGVGAEKDGIVTVLIRDVRGDGLWSKISWPGGDRLGPADGFVKTRFLTFL